MIKHVKLSFILIILIFTGCGSKKSMDIYSDAGLKDIVLYSNLTDLCKYYNSKTYIADFICNKSNDYVIVFNLFKIGNNDEKESNIFVNMEIKILDSDDKVLYSDTTTKDTRIPSEGWYSPNTYVDLAKLERGKKYKIIIKIPEKVLIYYKIEMYLGIPLSYLS